MLNVKTILGICILTIAGISTVYSQDKPDSRLVKNRGEQAVETFKYNRNSYNYYLFELDNSYKIVSKSDLAAEEQALIRPASEFKSAEGPVITKELIVPGTFNFYDFGITLIKDERIYIALDKKSVLVFSSIRDLTQAFKISPSNTK